MNGVVPLLGTAPSVQGVRNQRVGFRAVCETLKKREAFPAERFSGDIDYQAIVGQFYVVGEVVVGGFVVEFVGHVGEKGVAWL